MTNFGYLVEYFEAGTGSSGHLPVSLAANLNEKGRTGYRLAHMQQASVGYLLVFERAYEL